MPTNLSTSAQWEDTLPASSVATGAALDIVRLWPYIAGDGDVQLVSDGPRAGFAIVADGEGYPAITDAPGAVDEYRAFRMGDGSLMVHPASLWSA